MSDPTGSVFSILYSNFLCSVLMLVMPSNYINLKKNYKQMQCNMEPAKVFIISP